MEKHFEKFPKLPVESLLQYAMEALNRTTATDTPLTVKNSSVIVIGIDEKYRVLSDSEVQSYIDKLEKKEEEPDVAMADAPAASSGGDGGADAAATPMDTTA